MDRGGLPFDRPPMNLDELIAWVEQAIENNERSALVTQGAVMALRAVLEHLLRIQETSQQAQDAGKQTQDTGKQQSSETEKRHGSETEKRHGSETAAAP